MKPLLIVMLYSILLGLIIMWLSDIRRHRHSCASWSFDKTMIVRDLEHYFILIPYIGGALSALVIDSMYRLDILGVYLCSAVALIGYTYFIRYLSLMGKIRGGMFVFLITLSSVVYYGFTLITSLVYSGVM